jgi:hypothetical protein
MVAGPTARVESETCGPLNAAVTVVLAFSVTMHSVAGVPGKQPVDEAQHTNVAPALGTAVRITCEPGANEDLVGDCVMIPGPTTLVVSETFAAKLAVTVVFALKTTVHELTPRLEQVVLPQFTKDEFALGASVTVMVVLFAKDVPVGDCVMVPGPTTLVENVNFVTVVTSVPVNVAPVSDPPGPLILSVAARPPKACGANVIVIEHDNPAAIGANVQLLVAEKSPGFVPPIVIDDTVIGLVAVEPFCC